ncbi:dihydrofolate reductase family protein [Streptomyces sp. NPDC050738]|uniref:dihydrofolate reductase family protein n=1 Tax=Streptomyces sp. NPDC050738 TaxID=3154744 RepID=UPI003449E631
MSVIVITYITMDGFVSDPDGSEGTPAGGWMFRHGPEAVEGDKFRLGSTLDDGVLLLGRKTWGLFAQLWPTREDPFSLRMNAVPKLAASRTMTGADTAAWSNSQVMEGDLLDTVKQEKRDVIVAGSVSIVRQLMAADLIDEYRLLMLPTVLGTGDSFFPAGTPSRDLECLDSEKVGAGVLTRCRRAAR